MQSLPCVHDVKIRGKISRMGGVAIYVRCHQFGLPIPEHFQHYADPVYTPQRVAVLGAM